MCMGFVLNIDRKLYCMVQGLCLCSVLIYLSVLSVFWSARLTSTVKTRAVDRSENSLKSLSVLLTKPRQSTVRDFTVC